ncbi:MAG: phosphoenolpyruvate--protein phosphotransferase [Desulfobacteraceae bacterium]|nr:phosphoenolpyruvate--protein phosphotransferase [Desulfobacteraceae bacterium]
MTNRLDRPEATGRLFLKAPLCGVLVPMEQVPDPVFAQKMVGEGIAIDPVSQTLVAPCDGKIVMLHPAGHALTLATPEGIEVLMHVGLDTVGLKGEGFTSHVKDGDSVRAGQPLIDFDADFIATHAKSLMSMIVVTNPDKVVSFGPRSGSVTAERDIILELEVVSAEIRQSLDEGGAVTSEAILIANTSGLHARPAAVLANVAKKYSSDIQVVRGEDRANAKSVTRLMGMDLRFNDKVNLVAAGPDSREAVAALKALIISGLGEEGAPASAPASRVVADTAKYAPAERSKDPNVLLGVTSSPGLAVGVVFQVRHRDMDVEENAEDPRAEIARLEDAMEKAGRQLEALQVQLHGQADANKAAIFAAHQEVLNDPELLELVRSAILKGKSAPFAWQQAVNMLAQNLAGMNNALLAARAADVRDVGQRVVENLVGETSRAIQAPPDSILIAEELTPSDVTNMDRVNIRGFCTTLGSPTSHVAIIARSLDLPTIAGIDPRALEISNGTAVILDASHGSLKKNVSGEEIDALKARLEKVAERKRVNLENAWKPAVTTDGHTVEVVANIGGLADAKSAVALGGEGVGLLRTEFLFLDRVSAPSEDEQTEVYSDIARALGPDRPLVIRTLDVGGDKPLAYLPMPKEENPFLGERGLRVGLNRPEMLRAQMRAVLRASGFGKVLVMFPMVATLTEYRSARTMFEEERERLGIAPIPVGIMIEIPAAAIMAEQFAREADFFSIGTNDLTQYTLAMDRGHPKLASQVDALNPGVLHLIAKTVEGSEKHGRWTGVCGGIASDPQAVPILIGLGVRELSVSLPSIPAIKAQIREISLEKCRGLAKAALKLDTAAEVRKLVSDNRA